MKRREFIGMIGGAALGFPRPGYTQTRADLPLVGMLVGQGPDTTFARDRITAVRKGLQQEGFSEGTHYSLAVRYAEGNLGRYPQLASELATRNARVIIVIGFLHGGLREVSQRFPEVQWVFTAIAADLVGTGVIQSYVRPGGVMTGNVMNAAGGEDTMTQKRIELFKGLVPDLKKLGMIGSANRGGVAEQEKYALQKVAARLGFEFVHYVLKTVDDVDTALAAGVRDNVNAFYVSGEALTGANISRVTALVAASGKPSVGSHPDWARGGLLMSYAPDLIDGFRHAGTYAAKILKGTKAGELPIEQASKFTFVINLKTAKALGIAVPPNLLALADEVVE